MKVNVSKFQSIILKPKGAISDVEFHVSGHSLKPVSSVKLLGVQMKGYPLMTPSPLFVPRRLIKSVLYAVSLNILLWRIACLSTIPLLHPVLIIVIRFGIFAVTEVYISLTSFINRSLVNSSSYRDLLDKVSKPTLYVSRLKAIATEAYKCKANENPDYINVMLNPLIKPYNLRGGPRAEQPKVNTTSCGLHSFKYQIAKLWNEMPSHIKEATSLYNFKSLLSKWAGPE